MTVSPDNPAEEVPQPAAPVQSQPDAPTTDPLTEPIDDDDDDNEEDDDNDG